MTDKEKKEALMDVGNICLPSNKMGRLIPEVYDAAADFLTESLIIDEAIDPKEMDALKNGGYLIRLVFNYDRIRCYVGHTEDDLDTKLPWVFIQWPEFLKYAPVKKIVEESRKQGNQGIIGIPV